ncbi:MAG: PepSY domain-containing protein [Comamonadaceae bacterium]|nr:PepSY domain-containing protein [Comamonadaceae bacterium]
MKNSPTLRRGLLAMALGLAVLPTWADDDCDAPVNRWQSREAVRQMAAQQGWQIQRLKIDDGCYEIRGTDAQGRGFKAKIDPETLKIVKMKQRDHQRTRERDREHAAPQGGPQQPGSAVAPSPLFTPGTAPRGQVE